MICAGRINRLGPLLDVADDPVLVDDEGGAAADEPLLVEDTVSPDHLTLDVAQEREGHSDVFLKAFVGCVAVNADAYNLCVALLEVGDISLICL